MRLRWFWLLLPSILLAVPTVSVAQHPQRGAVGAPLYFTPAQPPKADPAPDPAKKPADPKKPRGAKPTPRGKLFGMSAFVPPVRALPLSVTYVPKQLSMWGNSTYGDCVTAEEAFNQAALGTFIPDSVVVAWAKKYGYLNGAYLTEVMDTLRSHGFPQNGNTYGTGAYTTVDFSNEPVLQAALSIAPVKIGIDADALPNSAGDVQGWSATGGKVGQWPNEDHCVSLAGYGTAQALYAALNVPLPPGIPATKTGYLLFTWSTIGFVDHDWLMSTCQEAYLRNPTGTVNNQPVPNPGPGPNPTPPPTPPVPPVPPIPPIPPLPPPVPGVGWNGTITVQNGIIVAVTPAGAGINTLDDAIAAALADPKVVAALAAKGIKGPIPAGLLIKLMAAIIPVVIADLQAGKTFAQMVPDIIAAIMSALLSAEPIPKVGSAAPLPWALAA